MGVTFSQFFPPKPTLTEANLPSQKGRVFVITGGTSGLGLELSTILFNAGATVYITGRSEKTIGEAIALIKSSAVRDAQGTVDAVHFDLGDLADVKKGAESLLKKVNHIDVLILNAGVSRPAHDRSTAEGLEYQMGVNCVAHLLFAYLLLPTLAASASAARSRNDPPGSVRVVWTTSVVVDTEIPLGGFSMNDIRNPSNNKVVNYANSKLGNWYLAHYFSTLPSVKENNILSVVQNPGNLRTNALRDARWIYWVLFPFFSRAIYGAYTELWATVSEELGIEDQGGYVVPWGRKHPSPREDLVEAIERGRAEEFALWCEEQIREFR